MEQQDAPAQVIFQDDQGRLVSSDPQKKVERLSVAEIMRRFEKDGVFWMKGNVNALNDPKQRRN